MSAEISWFAPDADRPQIIPELSDLVLDPIGSRLVSNGRTFADRPVLTHGERRVLWREFADRIERVAAALQHQGLAPGDRVAILADTCIEYLEVYAGGLLAGLTIVPLPQMASDEAIRLMLTDCGASIAFLSAAAIDRLGTDFDAPALNRIHRVQLSGPAKSGWSGFESWLATPNAGFAPVDVTPDMGFNIIYSSGTTGTPKGILQDHRMRSQHIERVKAFDMSPETISIVSTPFYSNTTLVSMLPTLAAGGSLVLMEKFSVEPFLKLCVAEKVTHAMLVPVQYERILAHPDFDRYDLSSFRAKFSTSAPLHAHVITEIVDRWPGGLYVLYGLTEGGISSILDARANPTKFDSVGKPTNSVKLRLLDENGRDVAPGEVGEIVGRAPAMMRGYVNRNDLTNEMLWRDELGRAFFKTGDLGRLDEDGFLYLMGRRKDMIISGGFNIFPADIEEILLTHDQIRDVAVIGIPSDAWGETPLALVVPEAGAKPDGEEITAWVNGKLGKLQRISGVEFRDDLPRSSIGKILKRELMEPYWRG